MVISDERRVSDEDQSRREVSALDFCSFLDLEFIINVSESPMGTFLSEWEF